MKRPEMKKVDGLNTVWFEAADREVHVEVFVEGYEHKGVDVFRHREWGKPGLEPAQVNWAAIGSVAPAQARAYAKAIEVACKIAEELDKELVKT